MDSIGKGIGTVINILLAGFVAAIVFGIWLLIKYLSPVTIETKQKIVPDYKLETKGKTVDTVWIYKKPKNK